MCKLAKIVSTHSFQAPPSQNDAPFKLAQAYCKLNFFLWAVDEFITRQSTEYESMAKYLSESGSTLTMTCILLKWNIVVSFSFKFKTKQLCKISMH